MVTGLVLMAALARGSPAFVPWARMGEHGVTEANDEAAMRAFMRAILADVHALEQVIDRGMIESGVRRIGAEQEMFLVDQSLSVAPVSTEVLATANDPRLKI